MYLGELDARQKNYFLDLGIGLATRDGEFSKEEKHVVHLLCEEMSMADRYTAGASIEEAIQFFTNEANRHVQRIVIFELLGIAMADSVFEKLERELIIKIAEEFSISEHEINDICKLISELYDLYTRFSRFVGA